MSKEPLDKGLLGRHLLGGVLLSSAAHTPLDPDNDRTIPKGFFMFEHRLGISARLVSMGMALTAALSACSLTLGTDYAYDNEGGYRDNFVASRNISRELYTVLADQGASATASIVADVIVDTPYLDRYYCPAGGIPGCDTTSEYTRSHPSDLAGGIRDAHALTTCVAITVFPPYNWTNKGRSNGCIYN